MAISQHDKAVQFKALHQGPRAFVIANPWDAGSARLLAGLGFQALATSSGAAAALLGRREPSASCRGARRIGVSGDPGKTSRSGSFRTPARQGSAQHGVKRHEQACR